MEKLRILWHANATFIFITLWLGGLLLSFLLYVLDSINIFAVFLFCMILRGAMSVTPVRGCMLFTWRFVLNEHCHLTLTELGRFSILVSSQLVRETLRRDLESCDFCCWLIIRIQWLLCSWRHSKAYPMSLKVYDTSSQSSSWASFPPLFSINRF